MSRYRAIVDESLCIGSSQCVATAPKAYRMNADGTLAVPLEGATVADLQAGASVCPVGAIRVVAGPPADGRRPADAKRSGPQSG